MKPSPNILIMLMCFVLSSNGLLFADVRPAAPPTEQTYQKLLGFSDGFAGVTSQGKWGFLDKTGKLAIKPSFHDILGFKENLASARVDKKWGYIGKSGVFSINPQFEEARDFAEGLAPVRMGGMWGVIDREGKIILDYSFEDLKGFSGGLAPAKRIGKWGFIDKNGAFRITRAYLDAGMFSDGLAPVKNLENQWGYIDTKGRSVIAPQFDDATPFVDSMALVKDDSKFGYINRKGNYVINLQYDDARPFAEGLAAVYLKGKWGYINQKGKLVIDFAFDAAGDFSESQAVVEKDEIQFYIDTKGDKVLDIEADTFVMPAKPQGTALQPPVQEALMAVTEEKALLPAAEASFGYTLFTELIKGVARGTGSQLTGWAASAIGIGNDQKNLGLIAERIDRINQQLFELKKGIETIQSQLSETECNLQTALGASDLAAIENALTNYNILIQKGSKATFADAVAWASTIAPTNSPLQIAFNALNIRLNKPAPGTRSAIDSCSIAMLKYWDRPLAEINYYDKLHSYADYFMAYQIQAVNLLVEAHHIMAVNTAGGSEKITDPSKIQDVCSDQLPTVQSATTSDQLPNLQSIYTSCATARETVMQLHRNIKAQLKTVGSGYAVASNNIFSVEGYAKGAQFDSTGIAWLKSLDFYPAYGCALPLSTTPCGQTVGREEPLSITSFGGYNGWRIARYGDWNNILKTDKNGGQRLSDLMYNRGFGYQKADGTPVKPDRLVISTGERVVTTFDYSFIALSRSYGASYPRAVLCIMDTSFTTLANQRWPFCDGKGGQPLHHLLSHVEDHSGPFSRPPSACEGGPCVEFKSKGGEWNRSSYLTAGTVYARYHKGKIRGPLSPYRIQAMDDTAWLLKGYGGGDLNTTVPTYRWPVLDISRLPCKTDPDTGAPYRQRNPAGPYTMCGSNFEAWLDSKIPPITGACQLPNGLCELKAGRECAAVSGIYRGDGTVCQPQPPTGNISNPNQTKFEIHAGYIF